MTRLSTEYFPVVAAYCSVVDALQTPHDSDIIEERGQSDKHQGQVEFAGLRSDNMARYLWRADYRELLGGTLIWDCPGLHLNFPRGPPGTWESSRDNPQPIAIEALIWATKAENFRRVRRLSVWCSRGRPPHAFRIELAGDGVSGVTTRQTIGTPYGGAKALTEIDVEGARGEFITEIALWVGTGGLSSPNCKAIKPGWKHVSHSLLFDLMSWDAKARVCSMMTRPKSVPLIPIVTCSIYILLGTKTCYKINKELNSIAGLSMAIGIIELR
ncbi:hypothetical protein PG994_005053 [Apiospora phragmitis]|uniref:Uncharacterized protein n=1 Tax=Apiospora phragmitis TaxID=2905665 RepID=A0ABR1VSB4_9PEZI